MTGKATSAAWTGLDEGRRPAAVVADMARATDLGVRGLPPWRGRPPTSTKGRLRKNWKVLLGEPEDSIP